VMDATQLPSMIDRVDLLQVGARNMQNFSLLKALGRQHRPVLLKRGLSATLEEWLLAAEYVTAGGNSSVILCERGIRTFGNETRFTLDLGAVAWLRARCDLPVVVDPSHATGIRELVAPMTLAAAAAGADGVMIEVHPQPEVALCDGPQALTPVAFEQLMKRLVPVAQALGRPVHVPAPVAAMALSRVEAR
jgi:3-deoxy-7-phosphoheptulonate synthase